MEQPTNTHQPEFNQPELNQAKLKAEIQEQARQMGLPLTEVELEAVLRRANRTHRKRLRKVKRRPVLRPRA